MQLAFILLCIAVIIIAAPGRSTSGWVALIFAVLALLFSVVGLRTGFRL
jgi:uncharacterized membrane protein